MAKNDDGFNLDDMMEIFGESIEAPAKKEEPRPAPAPAPAPVATVEKPAPTHDQLSEEELAVLAAYEKQKKEAKAKEEAAKRQKDEEARKILESYEKELQAAREREAKLRRELEEKQKQELEALKKKQEVAAINKEEEERKIIEEFERQAKEQQAKDEATRKAKEEQAQAELRALAEKEKAAEAARQAEAARHEEEIKAKAAAATASAGDKKESRLMELLAKAQKDIEAAAPAPLPGAAPAAAAAPPAAGSARDILIDVEQKESDAFNFMLDETRKAMFTFLAPMIGIKAATNMLNKTVEKARAKGPVVLKDANWKVDGSLREDGSIDPDRILANVQKVPLATRVDDFLTAFHALVNLRINAVEQGLGAKAGADLRMKMAELRRNYKDKGIRPEWIDLFFSHVIG